LREDKMNTLWGKSQTVKKIDSGIYWVTTAGHGGYMISKRKAEKNLPAYCLNNGFVGAKFNNYYCFEEDCAYAVLEYILSKSGTQHTAMYNHVDSLISEKKLPMGEYRDTLKQTIRNYYPEILQKLDEMGV